MTRNDISRRDILAGAAAVTLAGLSGAARAQAGRIVATTYPGIFEEAFRAIVVPAAKRNAGIDLTVTPMLAVEQVAKITAARANPPFDVVIFDEGPMLASLDQDILAKFPKERSKYFNDFAREFQGVQDFGPTFTAQPVGIAYNPKKVAAPKSWNDFWKPENKGRVGLSGMQSSLGTAYMCEIAKLNGGGEKNFEPAFARIKDLLPNLGALAPSPGALATLFQQGEIDMAPNYFNNVLLLKERGVDIDFAIPDTGAVLVRTTVHIVKNTQAFDLALAYVDTLLSPEVQQALVNKPYYFVNTSNKIVFPPETQRLFGANVPEMMKKVVLLDWAEINKTRSQLIERFTREVRK